MMSTFLQFLIELAAHLGIKISIEEIKKNAKNESELVSHVLNEINRYFYQTHEGIGATSFNGENIQYFSEFHKYWEVHHKEILNIQINKHQVHLASIALKEAITKYGKSILNVTHQTHGLTPKAIAQVRFFTANQDFRKPPENPYGRYLEDPDRFDPNEITEDPADFVKFIGITDLSQTDKRLDYARNAAKFLLDNSISAYDIRNKFNNDAVKIRESLVNTSNMGYGSKKANMFIRDMVEMGVWPDLNNFDKVDVASDINTMKLALRTGIIKTDIPLISSFLDIFCYQYSFVDEMSAKAWRTVWEEWKNIDPKTVPSSPCQMDFLLYRIGREYCDDMVVEYSCQNNHSFYHFGARLKNCKICKQSRIKSQTLLIKRLLPCQLSSTNLPREDGHLLLDDKNLLYTFDGNCILESVCKPKDKGFHVLDPPKSISIRGQTGWTNSYAYQENGGGGMMG
jgi:hypothetical protein